MITLAIVAALTLGGATVEFLPDYSNEGIVSYWNEEAQASTPCNSITQEEGHFTYCQVLEKEWVVYVKDVKQPATKQVSWNVTLEHVAYAAAMGESVKFIRHYSFTDDIAIRTITDYSTNTVFPCKRAVQKEGHITSCTVSYQGAQQKEHLLFVKE